MADITSSGGQSTDALNGKLNFQQSKNRIIGVDSNEDIRLLISAQDDDFAMKISRDGYDATVASDEELIFNSSNNLFKIVGSNTVSMVVPDPFLSGASVEQVIPHGLGFAPAYVGYVQIPLGDGSLVGQGQLTQLPGMLITNTGTAGRISVFATMSVDESSVTLKVVNTLAVNLSLLGSPWVFKYYLMQETAN